jgi:hypothetical protein
MQVNVRRSCVRNHLGDTKTEASRKPVPLHPSVVKCLQTWRKESPYPGKDDFILPSVRPEGKQPLSPDTLLQKIIRSAAIQAGIKGQGNLLAQPLPLACDQSSGGGRGPQNGAGTLAPRELADQARHLHANPFSIEKYRPRQAHFHHATGLGSSEQKRTAITIRR